MYGLLNKKQLDDIIYDVVDNLGGGENAINLLRETAQIESKSGTYPYNPFRNYGLGVMQFDLIGFEDTKERTSAKNKQLVKDIYKIDIDRLSYTDLRFSPLYSVIMARLKYILVPYPIPNNRLDRAKYWYKWYNGGGAGTEDIAINKYIDANTGTHYV